jgi:nitrogen fixation NifU-like protein
MFSQFYSKEVLRHVQKPQNMGEIKNPDGVSTVGNPVCGDIMRFFIKIEKRQGEDYIKDVKFQTLGCGAAIATSSMMTVLVKGKKLKDAQKISKNAIIKALDGLPPAKVHCSLLADQGLKKAIKDFRSRSSVGH